MATKNNSGKRRTVKIKYPKVEKGRLYVKAIQNNTIVTLTRENGDTLIQRSPAHFGLKGSAKSTPFASQKVLAEMGEIAVKNFAMKKVDVIISGSGLARDMVNFIVSKAHDLIIESISDITSVPHNGCRQPREARN